MSNTPREQPPHDNHASGPGFVNGEASTAVERSDQASRLRVVVSALTPEESAAVYMVPGDGHRAIAPHTSNGTSHPQAYSNGAHSHENQPQPSPHFDENAMRADAVHAPSVNSVQHDAQRWAV